MDRTIICPGCGWTRILETRDELDRLEYWNTCPSCGYENSMEPYRLLTLSEMFAGEGEYDGVYMDLFLKSLFKFLGYPDNRDKWLEWHVVHWSEIDGG